MKKCQALLRSVQVHDPRQEERGGVPMNALLSLSFWVFDTSRLDKERVSTAAASRLTPRGHTPGSPGTCGMWWLMRFAPSPPKSGYPARRSVLHPPPRAGGHILLFGRALKRQDGVTVPYAFLGPVDHVSHTQDRPIQFVWQLRRPMPADFFRQAKVAAG